MKYILLVLFAACASPKPDPKAERLKVKREIDSIKTELSLLELRQADKGGGVDSVYAVTVARSRNNIWALQNRLDSLEAIR
jgi:uncharacterized lipoprotein YmbA